MAGVPRTRGLDDQGLYAHALPPPICPNCDNELFAARPNGRIDLKPGVTAHLLAAATGNGKLCTTTPKLEISLNRAASPTEPLNARPLPADIAQSATVPFEAHDCLDRHQRVAPGSLRRRSAQFTSEKVRAGDRTRDDVLDSIRMR